MATDFTPAVRKAVSSSGLSVWLSPPDSSALGDYLTRLSQRYGTPTFRPHATLVSDELCPAFEHVDEVLKCIEQGVNEWKDGRNDLRLRFKDVRQGDRFYQCVLAAIEPAEPLLNLHKSMLRALGVDNPDEAASRYFPHMSLVYGDLSVGRKEEIIAELERRHEVDGASIVGEDGYRPTEILLVKTDGPPSDWRLLGAVDLRA